MVNKTLRFEAGYQKFESDDDNAMGFLVSLLGPVYVSDIRRNMLLPERGPFGSGVTLFWQTQNNKGPIL